MTSVLALVLGLGLTLQDDPATSRILLKDGRSVSGVIVREAHGMIVVEVPAGQMLVYRDTVRSISTPGRTKQVARAAKAVKVRAPLRREERVRKILSDARHAPEEHRYRIMQKLLKLGSGTAQHVANLLDTLDSEDLLDYAAAILVRMNDRRSLRAIEENLREESASVRECAVEILGQIGGPAESRRMRPLLADPSSRVRAAAAGAMGRIGDRWALSYVAPLCRDRIAWVRTKGIEALLKLGERHGQPERVSRTLADALRRAPRAAKVEILQGIALTKDRELWSAAARELGNRSEDVRAAAARALGLLRNPAAEGAILDRLDREKSKKPSVELARAASVLRLIRAVPALIDRLDAQDADIRGSAAEALHSLTGRGFGRDSRAWRQWWAALRIRD